MLASEPRLRLSAHAEMPEPTDAEIIVKHDDGWPRSPEDDGMLYEPVLPPGVFESH